MVSSSSRSGFAQETGSIPDKKYAGLHLSLRFEWMKCICLRAGSKPRGCSVSLDLLTTSEYTRTYLISLAAAVL